MTTKLYLLSITYPDALRGDPTPDSVLYSTDVYPTLDAAKAAAEEDLNTAETDDPITLTWETQSPTSWLACIEDADFIALIREVQI